MEDKFDELGQCIDSLNNFCHAMLIPMDPQFHIDCLKQGLPELVIRMRKAFVEATGENPWEY